MIEFKFTIIIPLKLISKGILSVDFIDRINVR
jgi:hypothetical protein